MSALTPPVLFRNSTPAESMLLRHHLRDGLVREDFLLIALALFACGLLATLSQELLQDGWLALVGGRVVSHGLPHYNTLTLWGHGKIWVNQQWLGQLIFYGLYLLGGLKLMVLTGALACLAALALAALCARRLGGGVKATTAVLVPTMLLMTYFATLRTQLFAFPLFVCVLYLLVSDSRRPSWRVLWALPILALWANLHGSVLLAAGLVVLRGLIMLSAHPRRGALLRACLLLLSPALILASPYGWGVISYYHATIGNPWFARIITEWAPTTFSLVTVGFYLLLLLAALLVGRATNLSWFERLILLGTGILGLLALRNTVWFALSALIILPRPLTTILRERQNRVTPALRRAVVVIALSVAAILLLSTAFKPLKPSSLFAGDYNARFVTAVSQTAAANPRAPVFSSWLYADYLLWQDPALAGRLVYDIRFELLNGAQLKNVFLSASGANWEGILAPGTIVVLPRSSSTDQQLAASARWQTIYRDHQAIVAIRR